MSDATSELLSSLRRQLIAAGYTWGEGRLSPRAVWRRTAEVFGDRAPTRLTVQRVLQGLSEPRIGTLMMICEATGITLDNATKSDPST